MNSRPNNTGFIYPCFILVVSIIIMSCEAYVQQDQLGTLEYEPGKIPDITFEISNPKISRSQAGLILKDSLPYSGYLIERSSAGNILVKSSYLNGKLEGLMTGYYENGQTAYERPYCKGEKHGEHLGWYPNNQLKFQYFFSNGLSIGNHKKWYEDGSLYTDYNYVKGKQLGSQKMWRPDGKLRANFIIRENGRKYGFSSLSRCTKIDSETKNIDPYRPVLYE